MWVHCCEIRTCMGHRFILVFVSPVWGKHRWEHNGSQTHSASSGMCWHHWHGRGVHHGSFKTNPKSIHLELYSDLFITMSSSGEWTHRHLPSQQRAKYSFISLHQLLWDLLVYWQHVSRAGCLVMGKHARAVAAYRGTNKNMLISESKSSAVIPHWKIMKHSCKCLDRTLAKGINVHEHKWATKVPGTTWRAPFSFSESSKASHTERTEPPAIPQYLSTTHLQLHKTRWSKRKNTFVSI